MIILKVTDHKTSDTVVLSHEVKNAGKITEEHHIGFHSLKDPIEGPTLAMYVLSADAARELKAHL
jgi:hypothetical protein